MIIGIVATLAGILMALAPAFIFVNQVIIPLISTFGGLSGIVSIVMGVIEGLGGVLAALSGPVGIVIAAVVAVIAVFVALWNSSEVVRDAVKMRGTLSQAQLEMQ